MTGCLRGSRLPTSVIEAAVRRGELPPGMDPFLFEEITGSVLLLRRIDDGYLDALIDSIPIPSLCATADATQHFPAGIVSGHPAHHDMKEKDTP